MVKETNWKPFPVEAPAFHEERHHYGHTKSSWLKTRQLPAVFDFDHPHVFKPGFFFGTPKRSLPPFWRRLPRPAEEPAKPETAEAFKTGRGLGEGFAVPPKSITRMRVLLVAALFFGDGFGGIGGWRLVFSFVFVWEHPESFKPRRSQAWGHVGLPKASDPFRPGEF